jgi:hypothetical protein
MSGDAHVRICESLGVQFPRATRLYLKIYGRLVYLGRAVDAECPSEKKLNLLNLL